MRTTKIIVITFAILSVLFLKECPGQEAASASGAAYRDAAQRQIAEFFDLLKAGRGDRAAIWAVEQVGAEWTAARRNQTIDQARPWMNELVATTTEGGIGRLEGAELIQVNRLPGTERYFRLFYMSHHTSAPLTWEFSYYVRPDGHLSLKCVSWSDENPFRLLSSREARLGMEHRLPADGGRRAITGSLP